MASQIGRALEFKVARPVGGNTFTIVGESERETPTIPLSDLTFPTRIPVQRGDVIGLYVPDTDAPCLVGPNPGFAVHRILDRSRKSGANGDGTRGKHVFEVRAVDHADSLGTAAKATWKV